MKWHNFRKKLYQARSIDQGNTSSYCPRCELKKRKTTLTADKDGFVYCGGCGWEKGWTESGLSLHL